MRKFTEKHPEVFKDFKNKTGKKVKAPNNSSLGATDLKGLIRFLSDRLASISPGHESATEYHRLMVGILELLFYPNLICPEIEREIHDGRKRIDIVFDNAAESGFFFRLHTVHKIPAQYIFVECKNYSKDPKNPEMDQISGRFSVNRGQFGIIMCRSIDDKPLLIKRCNDTYKDGRGCIIPIDDSDLISILTKIQDENSWPIEDFLRERIKEVIVR